jgi:hypothetical protein
MLGSPSTPSLRSVIWWYVTQSWDLGILVACSNYIFFLSASASHGPFRFSVFLLHRQPTSDTWMELRNSSRRAITRNTRHLLPQCEMNVARTQTGFCPRLVSIRFQLVTPLRCQHGCSSCRVSGGFLIFKGRPIKGGFGPNPTTTWGLLFRPGWRIRSQPSFP